MFRTRCLVVLAVAFACGALALPTLGQEKEQKKAGQGGKGGLGKGGGALVSDATQEKLKLSAEQKSSVTKLNADYKEKSKEITDKLTELIKKAFQDKDADARKELTEQQKTLTAMRTQYQGKVAALLNDDQKKTYEDSKTAGGFGGGGFGGKGGFGGGFGGGGIPGQVMSKGMQNRLKLTDEQKEKLAKLQKDLDAKLSDLLTPEQNKQLEDLKKGPAGQKKGLQPKKNADLQSIGKQIQQLQAILPLLKKRDK